MGFSRQIIPPGESATLTLGIDTQTVASYSGEVAFSTSDADENPYRIQVRGSVVRNLIDDGSGVGFSTTGDWLTVNRNGYDGGFRYALPGDGTATARWVFDVDPGEYRVLTSWRAWSNRATDAPFSVFDNSTRLATVGVNQQLSPNDVQISGVWFNDLGTFRIFGNQLIVELSNLANGLVVADAIQIVRVQ